MNSLICISPLPVFEISAMTLLQIVRYFSPISRFGSRLGDQAGLGDRQSTLFLPGLAQRVSRDETFAFHFAECGLYEANALSWS